MSVKSTPLVSVMMPVFNGIGNIENSIQSLLLQTYKNWECIIINDGSMDGTKEFLDSLNDERFIVCHFPVNRGRPFARQKALDLANGKYLAMLDADDWYLPEKLRFQVSILEDRPDLILVTGALLLINSTRQPIAVSGVHMAEEYAGYSKGINHGSSMIRMGDAKRARYNIHLALGEDLDFIERVLDSGKHCMAVPDIHYIYNVGGSFSLKKYFMAQWLKYRECLWQPAPLLKMVYVAVCFLLHGEDAVLKRRGREPSVAECDLYMSVESKFI